MEIKRSPRTITEEIYRDIKLGIIEGKFTPNEHLVERKLATLYGVSKTPVREALTRLEIDGLVKFVSLKGAVVRRLNKREILQILDIREYLEALAARKATELWNQASIDKIEEVHAASYSYLHDLDAFQSSDKLFHESIRRASENKFLLDMSEKLDNLTRIVLRTSMVLPTRGPSVAYAEHTNIVKAIHDGDPREADKQSRIHIQAARMAIEKFYHD